MSRDGSTPTGSERPAVSILVPARNEAGYLDDCLASIDVLDTDHAHETVVVDGDSDDGTASIARDYGARVIEGPGDGIGAARHRGARAVDGKWVAFVDADTTVDPEWLDEIVAFVRDRRLVAASSRCRMPGFRSTFVTATINRVFPRLARPILPGFNFVVRAETYRDAGGFPNVPNEDTAFSRRLSAHGDVAYHPDVLVETSHRRVRESGLTGTLYHYLKLDVGRVRARNGDRDPGTTPTADAGSVSSRGGRSRRRQPSLPSRRRGRKAGFARRRAGRPGVGFSRRRSLARRTARWPA